jgi:hypothetical protein
MGRVLKVIVYVVIGILTVSTAGYLVSGLFSKSEETGFQENKESSIDPCVTFSDGSSGYFTNDQINLMRQYGLLPENVVYAPVFSITFADGSSGNYNNDQIDLMRQYGLIK